jgi:hypothetical protein
VLGGVLGRVDDGAFDGVVRDVRGGPASVVIATVPPVVRSHPVSAATRIRAAADTFSCVLIC